MKELLTVSVMFSLKHRSRKISKQNLVTQKYQYIQCKLLTIPIKGKREAVQITNVRNERRDITTNLTEMERMRRNIIFNKINNPARYGK